MLKEMTDYFVGEKQESVLFMLAAFMFNESRIAFGY